MIQLHYPIWVTIFSFLAFVVTLISEKKIKNQPAYTVAVCLCCISLVMIYIFVYDIAVWFQRR